jgi:hypothetical protein
MAARFCIQTHVYCPAGGTPVLTVEGAKRDSASAIVIANTALFSVSAPVAGQGHVDGKLFQYLAAYAAGPEL